MHQCLENLEKVVSHSGHLVCRRAEEGRALEIHHYLIGDEIIITARPVDNNTLELTAKIIEPMQEADATELSNFNELLLQELATSPLTLTHLEKNGYAIGARLRCSINLIELEKELERGLDAIITFIETKR